MMTEYDFDRLFKKTRESIKSIFDRFENQIESDFNELIEREDCEAMRERMLLDFAAKINS